MLRFHLLATPADDFDVLIEPPSVGWGAALEQAARDGARRDLSLAGIGIREVRSEIRSKLRLPAGQPVVATGHQPELIHPGVWAKEVVASHAARRFRAAGFNLIVDHDAPACWSLKLPRVQPDGQVCLLELPLGQAVAGSAYEGRPPLGREQLDALAAAAADQPAESLFHAYMAGLRGCPAPRDWVGQHLHARRQVDRQFFEPLPAWRAGEAFGGPFVAEQLLNAEAFARCYNAALAWYRSRQGVRSPQRPLPDLGIEPLRVETALWIYRPGERRRRLWLDRRGGGIGLLAEDECVGVLDIGGLRRDADAALRELLPWVIRPRALTLTLWLRLLACDLFIHGIGGAKYDRITDRIIEEYFRCRPPPYACVSATLRLPLPMDPDADRRFAEARRRLRDLQFNPQRYVTSPDPDLLNRRAALIARSDELRRTRGDRTERRRLWEELRCVNQALIERESALLGSFRDEEEAARRRWLSSRIAAGREYFYALQPAGRLQRLREVLQAGFQRSTGPS